MKILSAEELRLWDQYSIRHEPISPIDLMERAARRCTDWITRHYPTTGRFQVFCGRGNNGGDGLAISRQLLEAGHTVSSYILDFGHQGTDEFQTNLARLRLLPGHDVHFLQSSADFPTVQKGDLIVDALFGSGLNRRLEGLTADLVAYINQLSIPVVAIDVPSGLFVDTSSRGNIVVKATFTLSFQCLKPAFLLAENSEHTGELVVLDIGLHPDYLTSISPAFEWIDRDLAASIRKPRRKFAHKGSFGHALLIAGSQGKMGAAILAAKACLRSGAGLVFCHAPKLGCPILQIAVPEAMVIVDENETINTCSSSDYSRFEAIGVGPGLGTAPDTKMLLREVLDNYRHPIVLDADSLNLLASQKDLLKLVPPGSILTPHLREFERLFGESANDFDRLQMALQKSREMGVIILLKGHYSFVATPDRKGFFNSTGNPGMATAGSGDVLTGMLTGLLAQGYSSVETAILGAYLHGAAGDIAVTKTSMEALIAGDIIEHLGEAFQQLSNKLD